MSFKIKCDNCNIEYEINHESPENVHTAYVICPKCKKKFMLRQISVSDLYGPRICIWEVICF